MSAPLPIYLYVVLLLFFGIGAWMCARPRAVVQLLQKAASDTKDPLAPINQRIFDSSRNAKNVSTFRMVGLGWMIVSGMMIVVVWASRR